MSGVRRWMTRRWAEAVEREGTELGGRVGLSRLVVWLDGWMAGWLAGDLDKVDRVVLRMRIRSR